MTRDVGVVVPAYRPDPDRLEAYLAAVADELAPAALHVELDSASADVRDRLASGPATVNAVAKRRGKGAAITAGFEHLDAEILVFTDADGSTPPDALAEIVEAVRSGAADVAVGSRRHPDATVRVHQSRLRRRAGDLFVRVARLLLPVRLHDYQCGAKAFDRDTWHAIRDDIVEPGFAWDIDVLTQATLAGATIAEVPIIWDDKPGSTVPPARTGLAFARALLRGWHRARCHRGSRLHRAIDRIVGRPQPILRTVEVAEPIRPDER